MGGWVRKRDLGGWVGGWVGGLTVVFLVLVELSALNFHFVGGLPGPGDDLALLWGGWVGGLGRGEEAGLLCCMYVCMYGVGGWISQ